MQLAAEDIKRWEHLYSQMSPDQQKDIDNELDFMKGRSKDFIEFLFKKVVMLTHTVETVNLVIPADDLKKYYEDYAKKDIKEENKE